MGGWAAGPWLGLGGGAGGVGVLGRLGVYIGVQQAADHALVVGVVFGGLGLEEVDALAAEGQGDLDPFLPEGQLGGRRQEIRNNLDPAQGLIRVVGSRAHL